MFDLDTNKRKWKEYENETQNNAYISLHVLSGINHEAHKKHNVLRNGETVLQTMGRQMYFYYLEWLFVYNQNKYGYM